MEKIAVWFSRGAASAVAAHETLRRYGKTHEVFVLTNPVVEEDEDNLRFEKDVADWLRHPIIHVTHSKYPNASAKEVWDKRKAMAFPLGAPCTMLLKKEARQQWEKDNPVDWHVLGFTADEVERHKRFVLTERSNVLPVLIDAGLDKQACYDMLIKAGIKPPRMYDLGYPNANCVGCVKATSPTYWNLVRETHPDAFEDRAKQSRELGARLVRVNNKRLFLDELDPKAKGRPLKTMTLDCGTFCEEPGA